MIVVNCRYLTQTVTGVQRYAEEITEALLSIRSDLVLVAPSGELRRDRIGDTVVQRCGRRQGHAWEQLELPGFVRSLGRGALLLSLTNTAPVIMRRQVMTHHDVTYLRFPQTYSRKFRVAYRVLSTLALRRAEAIVTVSEFSRGEIVDAYSVPSNKVHVVPNAVSGRVRAAPGVSGYHGERFFLAVASTLPHKNLDFLIRGFLNYADKSGSATSLKIVGSRPGFAGSGGGEVRDDSRVHWLGRVDDAELAGLYRGAVALVFPSRYEGFGIPPLEAQANGCPVLSSDAASLPEVLGQSALLFDPNDSENLVEVLGRIESDPGLRADLIARGHVNSKKFTWERSARVLSGALDDVLGG